MWTKIKQEARRNPRVRERMSLEWKARDRELIGEARVRNISTSGMMVETRGNVLLSNDSVLSLKPTAGVLPSAARVIWSRRGGFLNSRCCLGLEFVRPAQEVIAGLQQKISEKIERLESLERVKGIVGSILLIAAVVLLAYALFQQGFIRDQMERSSHMMLATSSSQAELYRGSLERYQAQELVLAGVTSDLEETRVFLSQAESMLAESKVQNQQLASEVARLKEESDALTRELTGTQQGLAEAKEYISFAESKIVYKGEIDSVENARAALLAYRNKIRDVRIQIRSLKRRAYLAKVAAQKERDRIALENGNRGFIIRDSKPFRPPLASTASGEKKVTVDVTFFE